MLSAYVLDITRQDTWFVSIIGFALGLAVAVVCVQLAKAFPDQTLFQINETVCGKVGGKIVSSLYVFHLLNYVTLDLRALGVFIHTFILPETPIEALFIVAIIVIGYAVFNGINTIGRISSIISIFIIVTLLITGVLVFGYIDFSNFMPMFSLPAKDYIFGTFLLGMVHFGGSFVFLMVFPFITDRKKTAKYFYTGGFISMLLFIFVVIRDWGPGGMVNTYITFPSFQVIRIIDIAGVLTRLEVWFAIVFICAIFYTAIVELFALSLGIAQLTGLKSYKNLISVLAPVLICYALIMFNSSAEEAYFTSYVAPFYACFFGAILPLVTLIIVKIKNKSKIKDLKRGMV